MAWRRAIGFSSAIVCTAPWRACSGQLDCMAVRRVEVGAAPFLLAPQLVAWVGNAQCGNDPLKRSEELPMIGSIRILVGVLRTGGDLCAKNLRPLIPLKSTLTVQQHDHGEGLCLPRLAKRRRAGLAQRSHPLDQRARSR